jgi:hypothetical protein
MNLDQLLEQARVPEPADNGFSDGVMQRIRAPKVSLRSRAQYIARPAVIAAAAVLATGGALAAAMTGTTSHPNATSSTSQPAAATAAATVTSRAPRATAGAGTHAVTSSRAGVASAPATPGVVRTFHNGSYEWGFTTTHTSFVLDKHTGLKLIVDTRGNAVEAGKTHDVVVTVINTSKSPMGISSQNGCAVSAAAWHGAPGAVSASPSGGRDPAKASAWKCPDGTDARSGGGEQFLLGPGGVRRETISLKLSSGDWSVAASCRCDVVTAVNPGNGMTLHSFDSIVAGQAAGATPGLLTPPVGVRAG